MFGFSCLRPGFDELLEGGEFVVGGEKLHDEKDKELVSPKIKLSSFIYASAPKVSCYKNKFIQSECSEHHIYMHADHICIYMVCRPNKLVPRFKCSQSSVTLLIARLSRNLIDSVNNGTAISAFIYSPSCSV